MRRIFEDASQLVPTSAHQVISFQYAQLSSSTEQSREQQIGPRDRSDHRIVGQPHAEPEHGAILGIETLDSKPASASEHTVDSWSDDSGYLFTESQLPSLAIKPSTQHIQRWLLDVSPEQLTGETGILSRTDLAKSANLPHAETLVRAADPSGLLESNEHKSSHHDPALKVSSHNATQASGLGRNFIY